MTEPQWLDKMEARAWRGYLSMRNLLHAELARGLVRNSGLSDADYEVLVDLSESECHRLRMHELASGLLWERSRLSHHITRMQRRGLVDREECEADGRGAFVVLTPAGLVAIRQAAPAHVAEVREHLFEHLTQEQVRVLAEISETVLRHLPGRPDD